MSFFDFLAGAGRQLNPFDNGATYKNPSGNGQTKSVATQVKDAGFGFLKGAVKPFVATGADVVNSIGNAEVGIAHKLGLAKDVKNQTNKQQFGDKIGDFAGEDTARNFAGNFAQEALTLATPAISKAVGGSIAEGAAGKGFSFLAHPGVGTVLAENGIEKAAPAVLTTAGKVAAGVAEGAAIGGPFNAAGTVASDTPLTAKNLAASTLKGVATGAVLGGVTAGLGEAFHGLKDSQKEIINNKASEYSGLQSGNVINDNGVGTLRDYVDYLHKDYTPEGSTINALTADARNYAQAAGIDVTSGSANEIGSRVENYISQRTQHLKAVNKLAEAGSLDLGKGSLADKLAGESDPAKIKNILDEIAPPEKLDTMSRAIAATNDPKIVSNILKGSHDITAPAETPPVLAPKDVKSAIDAEVQKRLSNPAPEAAAPVDTSVAPPTTPKQGFVETVAKSDNTSPELKQGVEKIAQKDTEVRNQQTLADNAKKRVADDYDGAVEQVKNTKNLTDEDVAIGQELVKRAVKEERINDAVDLVEHLDQKLRDSGRAIKAAGLWDSLSPEGVLKLAERQIRKAREGSKAFTKEGETAAGIKGEVESAGKVGKTQISKVVRDIANGKEDLTTGEKVANKVETAVSPKVKAKADVLVNELTKKIKQELLPENAKATPKSATDVLKEVFGRNKEAQEAFPEAQRILRDKFKDNPKALETLDKFFGSELGLPAADSTITGAIREQLKTNGESISNIISQSWENQKTSVEDISQSLVKEGFDKPSADALAQEVTTRLNKQVGEAKASVLARLAEDVKPKAKATYLDKLNKLSNLGALGDEDYLHIARAKLDLPQLTTETAGKLTDLSQKLQGLGENDPARFDTIRQIGEVIREAAPPPKPSLFRQLLGLPKSILASEDISGVGRQGSFLGTRWVKEYKDAFASQVKYFASEDAYNKDMALIAADPRAGLMKQADLALTGIKEYGKPEEAFPSSLAEKIPGIRASDRAYTGALTKERADVFNHIMDNLEASGVDINNMPESHIKSIGRYINTGSGRGDLGAYLESHSTTLGEALFSPRLWKSRLDVLNPKYYYDLKGPARALALQNAASFAGTAAAILGVAAAAGATVETDARSSDFLKIKVGNTRYDILGGFQQNLVFAWRELSGQKKSSTTGGITDLNSGKFGSANRISILSDLIQSKENPIFSTGATLVTGKDKVGNKVNPATTVGNLFVPLNVQDTYKAIKDTGSIPKGLLKATVPGTVGIGTNTYGVKDIQPSDTQKKLISKITDKGQQEAYTRFFQVTKQAAGTRTNVSDAINEALKANDLKKAQQLATDYNKQYASNFKDWTAQYGKYASDKDLKKLYNQKRITLTKASLKTRLKAIKAK